MCTECKRAYKYTFNELDILEYIWTGNVDLFIGNVYSYTYSTGHNQTDWDI